MKPSTGIVALDELVYGLRLGDNLVWKVDSVRDYIAVAEPFWQAALKRGEAVVYFRFADHESVVPENPQITRVQLFPEAGFEALLTTVHRYIATAVPATNYVFDMFSDLVRDWFSERMIGNFFLLTCPYIRVTEAIAYFGILRNLHSFFAVDPIDRTAQILIDVYRHQESLYLHAIKVDQRYSSSMYLFHRWNGDALEPITDSATTAAINRSSAWPGLQSASYRMIGMWDKRFMQAEECLHAVQRCERNASELSVHFDRLACQLLTQEPKMLELIRKYLTLEELIDIWKHVIGSGQIGGKAVGMLVARGILEKTCDGFCERIERHDSFFVAADLFYTFLVTNDCWWIREKQKNPATLLDGLEEARARILKGTFPKYILDRFSDMLDYFGQSPIVVRSSSLLEDTFLNSFPGKYDSIFCPNQGTRQQRLDEFLHAVRLVYASSLSEDALVYRATRGLLDRDEQMALLVQRVSGNQYDSTFYPHLAGVGMSLNPFVWSNEIDPEAGLVRLVFGLGTRAVDRADDDYTRILALDAPFKRPQGSREDIRKHTQRRVDYLDLRRNRCASDYFDDLVRLSPGLPVEWFAERTMMADRNGNYSQGPWQLELDQILQQCPLTEDLRRILSLLRSAYGGEVEIEFTVNLKSNCEYTINLLQCRPLRIRGRDRGIEQSIAPPEDAVLLHARGAILGASRTSKIERICYVSPANYSKLSTQDRFAVARLVGKIVHLPKPARVEHVLLIGPGRFGTTVPELGVPVSSGEINGVSVLCEVNVMHEGLNPELSLGTHFFHELVESNMLYVGCSVSRPDNRFHQEFFETAPNLLPELLPNDAALSHVVRVLAPAPGENFNIQADNLAQDAYLWRSKD
jgi:hypothetical protein